MGDHSNVGTVYLHLERVRLVPLERTVEHIAYLPPRWKYNNSIWQGALRFDIWINWDDRVRIEHDGQVVLRMRPPAGEIFRGIEDRRKAGATR